MDEAVSVTVAKAVVDTIVNSTLSQPDPVVLRSYAEWDLDLAKMDGLEVAESDKLRIDVVSHTTEQTTELSSRTSRQYLIPIDVAVRKRFGANLQDEVNNRINVEEIDELILLTQELQELFTKLRTADTLNAVWQSTTIVSAPVREHLRELRQFTGIVRIIFRADVTI